MGDLVNFMKMIRIEHDCGPVHGCGVERQARKHRQPGSLGRASLVVVQEWGRNPEGGMEMWINIHNVTYV